jgi:hypothetical protein
VCRRRRRHQDPPAPLLFITSVRRVRVGREASPGACITMVPASSRSPWIHRRYIDLTIRRPHRPSSIPVDAGCPRDLSSGYRLSSSVHTDETPLAVIAFRWLEPVFPFFLLSPSRSREHGVMDSTVICVCSLRRSNPPIQRSHLLHRPDRCSYSCSSSLISVGAVVCAITGQDRAGHAVRVLFHATLYP